MERYELVASIAALLRERGWHITFAESCTAGLCAAALGDVAGISHIFDQSFVTYANEAKVELLGVSPKSIEAHGVVSEEVALQMATGAAKRTGAAVAVGISGIAGPDGGSEAKPVGTVCFGFVIGDKRFAKTTHFGNIGRQNVRDAAVVTVYQTLAEYL